ncbi:hypothetical protein OPIT5_02540 [Opitutaceae bacterium TAV5]|nr:hypothetical protein OPIT5_02540 [Opitutaceae bacterium TAV5]
MLGVCITMPYFLGKAGIDIFDRYYTSIFFRDPFLLAGGAVFMTSLNVYLYLVRVEKTDDDGKENRA